MATCPTRGRRAVIHATALHRAGSSRCDGWQNGAGTRASSPWSDAGPSHTPACPQPESPAPLAPSRPVQVGLFITKPHRSRLLGESEFPTEHVPGNGRVGVPVHTSSCALYLQDSLLKMTEFKTSRREQCAFVAERRTRGTQLKSCISPPSLLVR